VKKCKKKCLLCFALIGRLGSITASQPHYSPNVKVKRISSAAAVVDAAAAIQLDFRLSLHFFCTSIFFCTSLSMPPKYKFHQHFTSSFLYKSFLGSFSLHTVWLCNYLAKEYWRQKMLVKSTTNFDKDRQVEKR